MSFPMKKFRVFLEKLVFIFTQIKISREHLPILVTNRHIFYTCVFFGGVRNDPMSQNFFDPKLRYELGTQCLYRIPWLK